MERLKRKYNCAQSVACTYCDLVGMDEKTMFRIVEAFGADMGCGGGICDTAEIVEEVLFGDRCERCSQLNKFSLRESNDFAG